jgi:hypothetical protein
MKKNSGAPPSASTLIPALVIPDGTDPRVAEKAERTYLNHRGEFACNVETAREMLRDYPALVTSDAFPSELIEPYRAMYGSDPESGRTSYGGDDIFNPNYSRETLKDAAEIVATREAEAAAAQG